MSSTPPKTGSSDAETSGVGLVDLPRAVQLSFQPISARSWKSQAGLASIKTSDDDCDDLPTAVSQFVLEICNLQLQQYHLSSLGEQALNLHVGQGMDYSVELSRTNDGEVVAVKHQKIETCDASVASGGLVGQKARRIRKALKEIQIMSHPPIRGCSNVLSVRGYGWTYVGGETMTPALVVEFASQGNLRQYLKMESAKSDSEKWEILHGIVKGLLSLHHSGIVHGDVKMENVLVAEMADGPAVPKIADFGSSIITASREHQSYWGTDIYNSPEIRLRTLNSLDTDQLVYCDVWAFGLLALEVALDGECYLDQEITSCIEHPDMEGFEESCFRRLNRAAFNDLHKKSAFVRVITKALKRTALDRGTVDQLIELFVGNHDKEREPRAPFKPEYVADRTIIDLADSITMKAILRGRGASTGTLEKLPWSVQVEIANRYKRLTEAEDSSVEGFAHLNLAICHYLGFGVERDTEKVREHIHASALRGTPEARLVINPLSQLLGFEGLDAVGDPRFDSIKYPEFDSELRIMLTARTRYPYQPPFRELLAHWFEKIASMGVKGWDLHSAAASNDFEATSRFIRDGSADYQNKKGQTALLLACQNGSFRIAKLLLENGSDPSLPDDNGYTPLHMLSMIADDDIEPLCKLVQSTNPSINLEAFSATPCPLPDFWDALIGTPLQWAVSAGNLVAVKSLLGIGADPINAPVWFSPIQLASSLFLPDILQVLLEKATPSDIERHGLFFLNGSHPFRQIMIHGKELPRTVQRTIQVLSPHGGVDITTSWGTTPLMNVALSNFSSTDVLIARELLKTCDTTIDSSRFSTIQAGIIGCNGTPSKSLSEITLMLIHAGFSTRAVSSASLSWPGWNAMHWAVAGRSFDVVKQLHRRDPELLEIQTSSENREFPLHVAASAYYGLEMVKLLLELGADPCAESGYGLTPLMHCIGESRLQLNMEKFEVLLKANSKNGYVVQRNGNTILHQIALRAAMLDIEGLPGYELLGYILSRPEIKALINKKNNNGLTPLHLVCVKPDYTSIKMLIEAGADVHSMTPEPSMISPLGLVLEYSREPSKGFAGNDLGSVWHKFSYHAACYLSDYMKGMPQDKQLSRLHIAAYCGFIEEVERLVEQEGVDISAINARGITPLQMLAGLHLLYSQKQLPMDIGYLQRSKHILTYLSTQHESKRETS